MASLLPWRPRTEREHVENNAEKKRPTRVRAHKRREQGRNTASEPGAGSRARPTTGAIRKPRTSVRRTSEERSCRNCSLSREIGPHLFDIGETLFWKMRRGTVSCITSLELMMGA